MLETQEGPEEPEDGEELPPGKLQDKWFREELSFKETVTCAACGKELPRETLACLFCGARVFQDSGLLGKILKWFRTLFK